MNKHILHSTFTNFKGTQMNHINPTPIAICVTIIFIFAIMIYNINVKNRHVAELKECQLNSDELNICKNDNGLHGVNTYDGATLVVECNNGKKITIY